MSQRFAAGLLVAVLAATAPAHAANDDAFFKRVVGQWNGPGEIVAGKYKGTKFVCTFDGSQTASTGGIALDGSCRMGLFSQKMQASVERAAGGYQGSFLDGSEGKGLDIISGNVDGDTVVFGLNRKQLRGAMVAKLAAENRLNVTVSVRVGGELVPVIGMNLKRGEGLVKQTALEQ
ncbi:hypothetical protein GCM10011390_07510 [Aureimonas endophytica]|uniref:Uncharacterized protein n=1 Tax=Aureimonas endophytica TaxID=2027858 RepID=A0A917E193_9HYPH|nr:hypothetical protein [Aureimonas endophytica]GGD91242.1 hypothetical protein GCM10011390_07510 [Aureimonas endophytica]